MHKLFILLLCLMACPSWSQESAAPAPHPQQQAAAPASDDLVIQNDPELPTTYPQANYEVQFHARGGVPSLRWKLEKGALPQGIKLEPGGLLHGRAQQGGDFRFTVSVTDSANPPQAVQKEFLLRVRSALVLDWKTPAHVSGNRIEGSVNVSNATNDDMDLTFIVLAVAGNGRATAIGYQHFMLPRNTFDKALPFGETLPHGGYVVHVDVVGEVPGPKLIYRQRLQTPSPSRSPSAPDFVPAGTAPRYQSHNRW